MCWWARKWVHRIRALIAFLFCNLCCSPTFWSWLIMDPSFLAPSASTSNWQDRRYTSLFECDFIFWVTFFQLVNGLVIQAPPVLWRDIPPFLHNLQNAPSKFSSNSNQGKVSSHFLLYLLIPDSDLEGGLEVELEQCFLGGLGCIKLSLIIILRITWAKNHWRLGCTPEIRTDIHFMFCFSVLQFIYHSIWWCKCLVLFPSINRSHGQHSTHQFTFLQPLSTISSTLKVLYHGSAWVNFRFLTKWISLYSCPKHTSNQCNCEETTTFWVWGKQEGEHI